ncbi:hypothetical protein GF374_01830 [Candidatus Woesearchaeota archaeon]|nr:hypothetical protein [Candidatus Woesearchaeota archaeon]
MKPFDIHVHFEAFKPKQVDGLIADAKKVLSGAINPGTYPKANRVVLKLARKYKDFIWPALAVHPIYLPKMTDEQIEQELDFISKQNIVAIGEAGLDYFWLKKVIKKNVDEEKKRQIKFFKKQIKLADKMNIPIIIHSRWSIARVIKILKEMRPKKAVLHGFSGNLEQAKDMIDLGYMLSNGPRVREFFKDLPLNKILLETDAPYMKVNDRNAAPKDILLAVKKLAELKNISEEKVIKQTNKNVKKYFEI